MNDTDPIPVPAGTPDSIPPDSIPPDSIPPAAPPAAPPVPAAPLVSAVRTQNRIAIAATLAVVIALVAGGAFLLGRGMGGDQAGDPGTGGLGSAEASPVASPGAAASASPSDGVPGAASPAASDPYAGLPSDGNRLGKADAAVVIDYWADYQCPFCATFALERIPELVPLIADGTVALVHRDFAFIGPESLDAAVAVRCAGREGRYWAMHDAVYAAQDGENEGAFAREKLVAIGRSVGLGDGSLEACWNDPSLLVAVLDDNAAAVRTAVQSTPTVDVNGTRFLGVPDPGEIEQVVAEAVAGASPKPLPTQVPITDPWAEVGASGRDAGPVGAPVAVELWLDYQAPESAAIARELGEGLRSRVREGGVHVAIRDLALLGDESVVAATALRCIDAQGGPTMLLSEVLAVSAQGAGSGIYTPANLLRLASQLGLDVVAMDACLADDGVAGAVRDETAAGRALGLETAPSVLVRAGTAEVGRFSGALDVQQVLATIDESR